MSQPKTVIERSLFSLTWPIFIDTLFVFLINVVDAWFLSRISDTGGCSRWCSAAHCGHVFYFFYRAEYRRLRRCIAQAWR